MSNAYDDRNEHTSGFLSINISFDCIDSMSYNQQFEHSNLNHYNFVPTISAFQNEFFRVSSGNG